MRVDSSRRLKDIASASAAAERVLESYGLDFCCHGEASLREACAAAAADVAAVERRLRACPESAPPPWDDVTSLIDAIVRTYHVRTRRALAETRATIEQLGSRALIEAFGALDELALAQMDMEESLFRRVRALANARLGRGPFPAPPFTTVHVHGGRLREGHARIHEALRRVQELAGAPEVDSAALRRRIKAISHAIHAQIHLENNELLPRAQALEPE